MSDNHAVSDATGVNAHPPLVGMLDEARRRTVASGSARILFSIDYAWQMPPMPRRRRGGLLRPFLGVAKAAAKRLWKLATDKFDWGHLEGEGVIDLAGRRYMLDCGSYAQLYAEGKQWHGRSGRPLFTLPPETDVVPSPLWLLDLLLGATEARDVGADELRGTPCRHLCASTDLSKASRETPGGLAVRTLGRFEDLLAMPVEVWIDSTHVRRVRFKGEHGVETVELWDFGIPVDGLDWTRLPTFRSPKEAAWLAAGG